MYQINVGETSIKLSNKLSNSITESRKDLISLCRNLIKIKSFSGKEKHIADFIEKTMLDYDYDQVYRDKVGNVIGVIEGIINKPGLMFDGHMDTVSEGELSNWSVDPFNAEINDNRIYGRGASDMKGALASMILAGSLLKNNIKLKRNLIVTCVVHEEDCEGLGIQHVIARIGKPQYVVLGEATDCQIAIGHRGRVELKIEIYGHTSHGSTPNKGMNAIYLMNPIITKIIEESKKLPSHPLLGKASVSVNKISCSPNEIAIVPDKCQIILDRRITPKENVSSIVQQYKNYLLDSKCLNYEIDIVKEDIQFYTGYTEQFQHYFPGWILNDHKLINTIKSALEVYLNRKLNIVRWLFSTDGTYTSGVLGVPTIGFGPGEEFLAHSPMENIQISKLIDSLGGYCVLGMTLN